MPQEQIPVGLTVTLVQNQIYALPAVSVEIQTSLAIQSSVSFTSGFQLCTSSILNSGFIRCVAGAAVVTLRKNGVT